jgi:hypothetical protein
MVDPGAYLLPTGLEVMTSTGNLQLVHFRDVKAVCFATEVGPENLFSANNLFERRPKAPGLWARFTLKDGDRLDGILSHNLLEWPESGYFITPPRPSASRGRVFLARAALLGTELRGVVGVSSANQQFTPQESEKQAQLRMFDS